MEKEEITTNDYLKGIVLNLPDSPGIYQYLNSEGTIIYVGKAKNLDVYKRQVHIIPGCNKRQVLLQKKLSGIFQSQGLCLQYSCHYAYKKEKNSTLFHCFLFLGDKSTTPFSR